MEQSAAQQQAQEALLQEIDAMQASHAQALRAADREREALAQVSVTCVRLQPCLCNAAFDKQAT